MCQSLADFSCQHATDWLLLVCLQLLSLSSRLNKVLDRRVRGCPVLLSCLRPQAAVQIAAALCVEDERIASEDIYDTII